MNLERIYAWLTEVPLAKTRISHFQKLANQKLAIAPYNILFHLAIAVSRYNYQEATASYQNAYKY